MISSLPKVTQQVGGGVSRCCGQARSVDTKMLLPLLVPAHPSHFTRVAQLSCLHRMGTLTSLLSPGYPPVGRSRSELSALGASEPGSFPFHPPHRCRTRSVGTGTQTVLHYGEAGAEPGATRRPSGCLLCHGGCCCHGHTTTAGPQPHLQAAHPSPGEPRNY